MNKKLIIQKTQAQIKKKFSGEGTGHDWWHIYRVWKLAEKIGRAEKADLFIVALGALLHDIADFKFHGGDDTLGVKEGAIDGDTGAHHLGVGAGVPIVQGDYDAF